LVMTVVFANVHNHQKFVDTHQVLAEVD